MGAVGGEAGELLRVRGERLIDEEVGREALLGDE